MYLVSLPSRSPVPAPVSPSLASLLFPFPHTRPEFSVFLSKKSIELTIPALSLPNPDPRYPSDFDDNATHNHVDESSSLLGTTAGSSGRAVVAWSAREEKRVKVIRAALYAVQVFYSFFIM